MRDRIDPLPFDLEPVGDCRIVKGVPFPAGVRFGQLLVTGPPGSGKTTLINRVGGWPEEGYIDLTVKGWWKAQALALRPREVHLGLPFVGQKVALATFEPEWQAAWEHLELEPRRICLPPPKAWFLGVDWRARYVFEFLLPEPQRIYRLRRERARLGTHPVDERIDLGQIRRQVQLFAQTAEHFHRHGMVVYIREHLDAAPYRIVEEVTDPEHVRPQ